MEFRSYNRELAYANMLFKRPFNNISIERDNKTIKFSCIIGNRSRILKSLENPNKMGIYKLPLIIIQRTGVTKNDDRLANVWNEVKNQSTSSRLNYDLFTPVPIDITYTVTIVSKYQSDIDMALSNFIPFFNKDLYVICQHPKYKDIQFTNQIIMDNAISEEHPDTLDSSTDDIQTATCSFTYKTYIFCGNNKPRVVLKEVVETSKVTEHFTGLSSVWKNITVDNINDLSNYITLSSDPSQKITLSVCVQEYVDQDIETEVSNVVSVYEEVQESIIPTINKIHFDFYAPETSSAYTSFIKYADDLSSTGVCDRPYVDRFILSLNELSDCELDSYHYQCDDQYCQLSSI